MWFLEHDSLFGGKRVWLRPGSQQLFGRTKSTDKEDGKSWKIDNKVVSRKHFILKVHEIAAGDGTKLHTRSQVEVTDLSCRQGTTIDETQTLKSKKNADDSLDYDRTTLTGTEHTIRLAQGYPPFRIVWHPIVATYAARESKDFKARSAQLHELDIKTTGDFLFDKTTHVVTQKRNLPKVLSGLVAGKHVVGADFLDAVLSVATTSVDEADNYVPSKLEDDFDTWWPKEKEFIPPAGAEPVPRPQEMLEPDPSRSEVFSGLTFIFLMESQYNSLLEPVTGGGGKALFFEARPGETTIDEYVDYVHNVLGKKKRSTTNTGKIPVVTVRLSGYPDGMEDWAANFVTGVDQALNQRSILQNEFLDVIITKERSALQRPPTETVEAVTSAPANTSFGRSMRESTPPSQPRVASPEKTSETPVAKEEEPVKTIPRKRVHRPKTTSRFTGFDDYEPPPKRSKVESTQMEDVQQSEPTTAMASQSQAGRARTTQSQVPVHSHVRDTVEREEQMDALFPAAAAIKRQRAATRAPSASVEPEAGGPVQSPKDKGKGKAALERLQRAQAKVDSREVNVREQTRQRIKQEEERRKADEESLRAALEGVDIAEMRNLATIETMELRSRSARPSARESQTMSDRWNPEWNGRKNFKKFRRKGAERGAQGNKVIVTLEEAAPRKGFGDTFFLEDIEPASTFRSRMSAKNNAAEEESDSEPEQGFVRQKRGKDVVVVEDSGHEDGAAGSSSVPAAGQRSQRSSNRTQRVAETQIDDAEEEETSQAVGSRGRKRGATSSAEQSGARKKGRVGRKDDDSDEEETGFRFKRRG